MLSEPRLDLVNPQLLSLLRCPICKGGLTPDGRFLCCGKCHKEYPIVLGIPDLRLYEDPLIPLEDDYRKGDKVEAQAQKLTFAELVRYYWSLPTYPYTPPELYQRFIEGVLLQKQRFEETVLDRIQPGSSFLDVGCGTAALVEVMQRKFDFAVGCDVAFRWLLIARKRLQEAGLPANLVCCCADYLPFPEGAFQTVGTVSLLEHVDHANAVIGECSRVTKKSGRFYVYTSNRFSLAPEPHVRVWGVGFLPRKWMPAYVKWRSGLAYEKKKLLSRFELSRFLKEHQFESIRYSLPEVTKSDWKRMKRVERLAARVFRFLSRIPFVRQALVLVSPVLQVMARKAGKPVLEEVPEPEAVGMAR